VELFVVSFDSDGLVIELSVMQKQYKQDNNSGYV
jgi:hypothetical protein